MTMCNQYDKMRVNMGGGAMLTLYHGSTQIVDKPEIRTHKYHKDFYWGFYCTQIEAQAVRWATRRGRSGVVNVYSFERDASLRILRFEEMDEAWLDFIAACRTGHPHDYDVVEGPMADDAVFNYVQSFLDGEISRAAFWELVKFKHPTHQISFHTEKALQYLKFERSYPVDVQTK